MIKKIITLFLLVSLITLSSCGFENEYSGDTILSRPSLNEVSDEQSSSPDESTPLDNIEGYDYDGKKFIIVTTDKEYLESKSGESLISKAVSNRNGLVETKFNVDLEIRVSTADEIIQDGISAISKGKHYADLVVAPANTLSRLEKEGCLVNINALPFYEQSTRDIDKDLVKQSEINGKLYLLFGSLTQTENSAWCVFYNETIAQKTGIDPYDLYEKGEWTWEKFLEYSEKADEYAENGFISVADENELINSLWASTGNRFFGECSESLPALPTVENGKAILSSIKKIIKSKSRGEEYGVKSVEKFISGKSGMLLCGRNAVYQIDESGLEWNVVPMPKYNEESGHYAYVDGEVLAAAVPTSIEDSDFVGRILNALVVSSAHTVTKGIDQNELYYYWDDNEMALRMEEIKNNLYLDMGIIYAYSAKEISAVTTDNIKTSLDAGIAPFQFYHSTKSQFNLYSEEHFG